ncbi:fused response regulator/phosphatase [Ketobacter sp.]|uniref:fused response regulator/phosphatase n=1 Tax=Ketobacter sp. TaxID=2083498 RepID=UPI000F1F9598|nr:fused response regulator/phosphatase [Ketobacter sp.]RLT96373.1 MAG: fused response regulator/phosphatase [Ketobacter sp.]
MKSPQKPGNDITILLIDQLSELQAHISGCLRDEGYHVHIECEAEPGLRFWAEHHPQVVICDVASPEIDGLSVLSEITASEYSTQVIMISDAGEMNDVVKALRLGATDFLLKPISDPEVLLHAVKRALDEHAMLVQNQHYREQLEQTNRELNNSLRLLKEDQEAARVVQLKMLPEAKKQYGNIEIEYKIIPSLYLSGDFVDYFSLGQDRLGFYLADVSGHGASSAFVTVLLKTMANRVKQHYSREQPVPLRPAEILKRANDELLPLGLGKHLAVFCGYIDYAARKLVYCSAAHFPPPVLVTNGGALALEGSGLPVGLFEEVAYENQEVSLGESFDLVVFSDGILEVMPQQSVAQKEQYLMEIVSKGIHNIDQLLDHLDLRNQDAVPDDIALMTVSCSPR